MAKYHISIHGEPVRCPAKQKCRVKTAGGEHFEGDFKGAVAWAEEKNAEEAGGSFGKAAVSAKSDDIASAVDTTEVNYGGIEEVPDHIEEGNENIGARDAKEVKRNEKTAIAQVNSGIGDSPEVPVVKKRKNRQTGYRDTTVYSPDGEKFVTVRANEDDPQKSYAIDGTSEQPRAVSLYEAPSATSRINDYARQEGGLGKSQSQREREAREYLSSASRENKASSDSISHFIDSYSNSKDVTQKNSGVTVSKSNPSYATINHVNFYDGSRIDTTHPTEDSDETEGKYFYLQDGVITEEGTLNASSTTKIQSDIREKAHASRARAEYDSSAEEIHSILRSRYKEFQHGMVSESIAYPSKDGGSDRAIIIRGQTDNVYLIQKNNKNIEGENDLMYDVVPGESVEEGGIYMKDDTRDDKIQKTLPRFLDALKRKDADGNPNNSIYDYIRKN